MKMLAALAVGIDPGASGGIVTRVRGDNGVTHTSASAMPATEQDIHEQLHFLTQSKLLATGHTAYIEEVGGYVGVPQPGSAMFKFGRNFGFLLGCLTALRYRIILLKPQKWQKLLGLGTSKGATKAQWKNKLKAEAQRRYPKMKVTLKTADAFLILDAGLLLDGGSR